MSVVLGTVARPLRAALDLEDLDLSAVPHPDDCDCEFNGCYGKLDDGEGSDGGTDGSDAGSDAGLGPLADL